MGESVIKGKKIRKESRLQKEGIKGFSSSRFRVFFWEGWHIYVREEREKRVDSFDCEEWKGAEEQENGDCNQESAKYASCSFFLFFWFSYLHSTLDSLAVFKKLFLLIGVDIEGHLFTLLNRNFLQACSVMIVFLIS